MGAGVICSIIFLIWSHGECRILEGSYSCFITGPGSFRNIPIWLKCAIFSNCSKKTILAIPYNWQSNHFQSRILKKKDLNSVVYAADCRQPGATQKVLNIISQMHASSDKRTRWIDYRSVINFVSYTININNVKVFSEVNKWCIGKVDNNIIYLVFSPSKI